MVFFTEPYWERGREKSGAVHRCLMSHRQQKRGATLKFGGFLTYAMEMYNLEPADKPQLAHLEKMFQHLPASGTMKLNCVFKAPKNPRRETAMCIPKYKVPCKEHV